MNLYATRFDQVMDIVEKRAPDLKYIFLDTPGQIEVFTWSASGAIITEALANTIPSCILYVIDTPRTARPATFMSNMLYACSILYKTRLPLIVVFNKVDVMSHDFAVKWMSDFEAFQEALSKEKDHGYSEDLTRSMSLTLDEFYHKYFFFFLFYSLQSVGVSAQTGEGINELFECIDDSRKVYLSTYKVDLDKMKKELEEERAKKADGKTVEKDDEEDGDDDENKKGEMEEEEDNGENDELDKKDYEEFMRSLNIDIEQ